MGTAHEAVQAMGHAMHDVHAPSDKLVSGKTVASKPPELSLTSPAFATGGRLPISCTVDGAGTPPVLEWSRVPRETQSIVVVCEDPDAPLPKPFVHWIVYEIPPTERSLDPRAGAQYKEGKNSKLEKGFTPAAPPPGHGVHHYHFEIFALDTSTEIDGLGRGALIEHMKGHVLAWGELVGTYERD